MKQIRQRKEKIRLCNTNCIRQVQPIHQTGSTGFRRTGQRARLRKRDYIFTMAWSKISKNWQGALIPNMPSVQLILSPWSQKRMCRILNPLFLKQEGLLLLNARAETNPINSPLLITNRVEERGASQRGCSPSNLYDL